MAINPNIFRNYDIRGSSLTEITPINAYKIGLCFAKLNITEGDDIICVARDGRISSPALHQALINGILESGARAVSIGIAPTPELYFADKKLKPAASIMITGSHNQKDDNGFKMVAKGKPFFGDHIHALQDLVSSMEGDDADFKQNAFAPFSSSINKIDLDEEYTDRILEDSSINKKLKVAWDPGNGAAGKIVELLAKKLPNKNIVINSEIDGNFPNHHPDPTIIENLQQLMYEIDRNRCDFGIAFDGDADRIGIVTKKKRILWGDQMLCLFAKDIIKANPGATIIADVKTSQIVFDYVAKLGGNPLMWKTGHSLIKTKMLETNALLAGEMSGHMFFADKYYGYDDGIYTAIRMLDLISKSDKSIDELLDELPQTFATPEIRIDTSDDTKFKIIQQIKEEMSKLGIEFNDIDGLRVNTDYGWWLLRASNTQAAIIARCESTSKPGLEILKEGLNKTLAKYNLSIDK